MDSVKRIGRVSGLRVRTDVEAEKAAFMADSQVPWGIQVLSGTIGKPAWRHKPGRYLLLADGQMIPPDIQRADQSGLCGS